MTREKLDTILSELHKYADYLTDKKSIYNLVNKYRNSSRDETYELHDLINDYFAMKHTPKNVIYGLLHEIVIELQKDPQCSEQLYDLLTNYLDDLEKYPLY